jgi:hypothetical protein
MGCATASLGPTSPHGATACGDYGAKVREPANLPTALRTALAHPGPALLDVDVDPHEPLLPGKVAYEQAKGFAQSWLRGQPHKAAIASTTCKTASRNCSPNLNWPNIPTWHTSGIIDVTSTAIGLHVGEGRAHLPSRRLPYLTKSGPHWPER